MLRRMSETNRSNGLPARRLRLAAIAALAAVAAAPLLAGGRAQAAVTLVMQRGASATSTLYVDGDKMRIENVGGAQEHVVIIDAAGKRMLMLNDADKSYTEVTEADMKRFGEMMTTKRAEMAERMKSMPPEQRKRMEQALGGGSQKPPELKFERLGQKKSVNGFSCDMYRVLSDAKPKEEDCIAPWSSSVLQRSDFAGLRKFAEDMAKDTGATGAGGGRQMFEQFDKYPGFPVTRHPLDPNEHEDEQLKSVKRGSIPAASFAVPTGFTKKESPMGAFGGGPHGPGPGHPMPPQ
jgi:uncharacterized protein DUF4412